MRFCNIAKLYKNTMFCGFAFRNAKLQLYFEKTKVVIKNKQGRCTQRPCLFFSILLR